MPTTGLLQGKEREHSPICCDTSGLVLERDAIRGRRTCEGFGQVTLGINHNVEQIHQ